MAAQFLAEKTEPEHAEGPLDQFLFERAPGEKLLRLPSMRPRYVHLAQRAVARMQRTMEALEAERSLRREGLAENDGSHRDGEV